MQRNNHTVYVADRQEYLQASAKYAEYIEHDIEQRIAQLRALKLDEYEFPALRTKIFEIITAKVSLQRLIARNINSGTMTNKELVRESIHLLKQMHQVELIDQYLPLIKSTLPHCIKSNLIAAVRAKNQSRLSTGALYNLLLTELESSPQICESLSLITSDQVASSEDLLHQTCELIELAERNSRRKATAAIAFDMLWIAGQKLTPAEFNDPLVALATALQRIGVDDPNLTDFLLEFLNQQALLLAEKYQDIYLKKTLVQKERSQIEAHLSFDADQQAVVLKILRKYPTLYPNDPSKLQKNITDQISTPHTRIYAQSATTLMIKIDVKNRASVHKVNNPAFASISVELVDGSLEIFDQRMREFFIRIAASMHGKQILRGAIGTVNGDLIIEHVISRYEGFLDERELRKQLIASQDPLAVVLMARANAIIMSMILNSAELLQIICTDKYCDKHVAMLICLYSKDIQISKELALFADCIKLLRAEEDFKTYVKGYFASSPEKIKYLIAAFFSYRGNAKVIVELLQDKSVCEKIDSRSLMSLAFHFREVAKWLLANRSGLIEEQLTSDQIVSLLLKHPRLWEVAKSKGSVKGNTIYNRLSSEHLQRLIVENVTSDSKTHAAKSVFKSTTLLPKLYPLGESDPDAFLQACIDADSNYFNLPDEAKKIVNRCILSAKLDTVSSYLNHLAAIFLPNQFGLLFKEMIANKLDGSYALEYFASIMSCKVLKNPELEYDLDNPEILQVVSRLVSRFPELGVILQNEKMRNYLYQTSDRELAMIFFHNVVEHSHMRCFNGSQFQLTAFKILKPDEIKELIFKKNYAHLLLNLFSKDLDAMIIFEQAGIHTVEYKYNLVLKYATAHQLLLILLRSTEQIRRLKQAIELTHEKLQDYNEKIQDAQRLVTLCELTQRNPSLSNSADISPVPRNRKLDAQLASLESDRKAFVEFDQQNIEQKRMLKFLEDISKKIVSTQFYLEKLLHPDSLGAAERALLINLFPIVIQAPIDHQLLGFVNEINTDASVIVSRIKNETHANACLIAAFNNPDILACVLSRPDLQKLLMLTADVRLITLFCCLHGINFEVQSDWIILFERLIQSPDAFAFYKPMLLYHQQQRSFATLFHFFAAGNKEVLSLQELNIALGEESFMLPDFIRLLLDEYQKNGQFVCRNHLIKNVALRAKVFNHASVTELTAILNFEVRLRQVDQLQIASAIETTLLSSPIFDDILRLAQPQQLFTMVQQSPKLLPHIIELFLRNPVQRELIIHDEPLLQLLLNTEVFDKFLAMAILMKQPNKLLLARLTQLTGLIDFSKATPRILIPAQELVKLLIIAEQQQYDYADSEDNIPELSSLWQQGELIANRIFRADHNTIVLAIPLLLRYLKSTTKKVMQEIASEEFQRITLNGASIGDLVNFFCAENVRKIILEHHKKDFQKRIKTLLCQCFLHSSRRQLLRLCDPAYLKIIFSGIADFMGYNDIKKKIIAPRLIYILDHLFLSLPHYVVELLLGYDLALMTEAVQPGIIYLANQGGELLYRVIDPNGALQNGTITSNEVKSLTDTLIQLRSLEKIKGILLDILHVTSERKHTHLVHEGHLFELMTSTDANLCLFMASSIYQGSERVRAALSNQFGAQPRSPRARNPSVSGLRVDEGSEGSSNELRSAIRREGKPMRFSFAGSSGESSVGSPNKTLNGSLQKK